MYDLEKLEKKFHEFIKPSPDLTQWNILEM